ncbi:NAD(P)H-dependent oxidoreductase [Novosphingobium flavum]|uniref:NAD(P)H-dependent oxidoreductase n=1 Tax=Novosphingobium flavum TaxID=1778672 RepID=A0A7X1FP17_9SPHN|nr:NAD(P)H-dependent oxidoreductase [Novosphingobium flavum]MBC2663902.1 NAD(P)H-dependent oxidoreductase [Novosphingobium flavum]
MNDTVDTRRILVIDGHPDPARDHYVHALAEAYAEGALSAGHTVERLRVGELDFPLLRSPADWMEGTAPPAIVRAQEQIRAAEHIVMIYPLWLGDVPALFKAFLEQALRPGFALAYAEHGFPKKLLRGRSARVVVTMGMPGIAYRVFYRAHSLKSLERNVLRFVGIDPVETTVIGGIDDAGTREEWLGKMRHFGENGA